MTSRWPLLRAPTHWQRLDFISDLHLQASDTATFDAWQSYLQTTRADAVFILGDLFEVWVGDDLLNGAAPTTAQASFEIRCTQVLHAASQRLTLFLMHGNRDFLLGAAFAQAANLTLLDDPVVLDFADQRWLLSHGDALCLADTDYLQFRAQVRNPAWQQAFLSQPLPARQAQGRAARAESDARKSSAASYADLDTVAVQDWLTAAHASALIHGHTHRPAEHALSQGRRRIVLSDWDTSATPARAEVLRLTAARSGQTEAKLVQRLSISQAADI